MEKKKESVPHSKQKKSPETKEDKDIHTSGTKIAAKTEAMEKEMKSGEKGEEKAVGINRLFDLMKTDLGT